jgi:hypothetical protein
VEVITKIYSMCGRNPHADRNHFGSVKIRDCFLDPGAHEEIVIEGMSKSINRLDPNTIQWHVLEKTTTNIWIPAKEKNSFTV